MLPPLNYQVGDTVTISGHASLRGEVWRAMVVQVREHLVLLRVVEGGDFPNQVLSITLPPTEGLSIQTVPRVRTCTVCKREADAGMPCWWCGTV
jgi:hypothetical protein